MLRVVGGNVLFLFSTAVNSQTGFLEAQVVTFNRHRSRLAVVREQKEKARLDMLGEKNCDKSISFHLNVFKHLILVVF